MPTVDAAFAVLCSYLGLTARDLAEIGKFSERFARDLLAGRRSFPKDVQQALLDLRGLVPKIHEALYRDVLSGELTIYIFRTVEQLRSSPIGDIWPNAYLGLYRVAAFQVMDRCNREERPIQLVFAETPAVGDDAG